MFKYLGIFFLEILYKNIPKNLQIDRLYQLISKLQKQTRRRRRFFIASTVFNH